MSFPLNRLVKLIKRAWMIYVAPPRETKVFLKTKGLPTVSRISVRMKTALEPKQVVVDHTRKLAYVSCMKGHMLQEFSFANNSLVLTHEWSFPEQCIECESWNGLILITTTNFKRGNDQSSHLWILDPVVGKLVSRIDTQGEWSKVIVVDTNRKLAFISNWHSNDISIIDLSDLTNLKVLQKIPCDEAPRGLALKPDGTLLATSFYGGGIFSVIKDGHKYRVIKRSAPFDPSGYNGNMRDILLTENAETAFVSNLGRNMVHWYNTETLELIGSLSIPRKPNSMRIMRIKGKVIGVSCRKDNLIFFFNMMTKKPIGVSAKTEKLPTGLAAIDDGFIVTNFDSSSIELHKFIM